MFITAPVVDEDISGDSITHYRANFGEGFRASVESALATNPVEGLTNIFERAQSRAMVRTGSPYIVSPDDANTLYGDVLGEKYFTEPVSGSYARTLFDNKRKEIERAKVMERAPKGVLPQAGYFAGALGASALDPINIGSAFIPVLGEARFAALAGKVGMRSARIIKGAAEGAVGAVAVEPLVYAGAQAGGYQYDYADSLLNVAIGTVLGGGLHFAGGEAVDAWKSRKVKMMAETGAPPRPVTISEAVDNLSPQNRGDILRAAIGQMADGKEIDIEPILQNLGKTSEVVETHPARRAADIKAAETRMAELDRELYAPEITPERRTQILEEMNTLAQEATPNAPEKIKPYADIDEKVKGMKEEFATRRLASLDKKVAAELALQPKELYEREALAARLRPADKKRKEAPATPSPYTPVNNRQPRSVRAAPEKMKSSPELEMLPRENTITQSKALPEDIEQHLAELDAMLDIERKADTLTAGELALVDAAGEAMKKAEAAERGLLAAATCIYRKAA